MSLFLVPSSSDEEVICLGPRLKLEPRQVKLEHELRVEDLLDLDNYDIVNQQDLITITEPKPKPEKPQAKTRRKTKRTLRNTPLFRPRPRTQVSFDPGETACLPTTTAEDQLAYLSRSLREGFRRLRKQVPKILTQNSEPSGQVLEFRVTHLLPYVVWRRVQTSSEITFTQLHVLIAGLFCLDMAKAHMFIFKDPCQTERILGDPAGYTEEGWEDIEAVALNLSSSYAMLQYVHDFDSPNRFEVKLLSVKDKNPLIEYPKVVAGKDQAPSPDASDIGS